ncbi:unnamed protein product [Thlaspi arvense]|uniref:RING-type E3 ubiquitin transferase n=1 Tax=Thlaspi arvense TaxID=13288 RepID=A0AAU9RRU1_THLAR|nr:unnamed protein product [Thlaspi arvense]
MAQLPCDGGNGNCSLCKSIPLPEESLTCSLCGTPWHVPCLSSPPESLASTLQWHCPDCTGEIDPLPVSGEPDGGSELLASIRAIEADDSLTDADKAKKRQELLGGKADGDEDEKKSSGLNVDVLAAFGENLECSFCMQLPERPVTTPCGHNFCLKCFEKWLARGRRTCAKCRSAIPAKMASNPRINASLVSAIRLAKVSKSAASVATANVYHAIANQDRPEKAYTTDRAKKTGKANAASGRIYVTIPSDHFGPIPAENDPVRNQGVLVGESWEDRMDCRQWGAHFPHIAGIAGQSKYGAQSVALSGGYVDDEDHGEWFLYTGSGGRDLSGNKRTNKAQSFDQVFEHSNEALKLSCEMGYPVRVVRSHKEKRSAYAPEVGLRYDGVYRIEKCWRKVGVQGSFKVCRYLFVRCDNEPAPWTSDEHGDRPRPLPNVPELKMATDLFERNESPSWDFNEGEGRWVWTRPPPPSQKPVHALDAKETKSLRKAIKAAHSNSTSKKLLNGLKSNSLLLLLSISVVVCVVQSMRYITSSLVYQTVVGYNRCCVDAEFKCLICKDVMTLPVTTPCGHSFCKGCLEKGFAGKTLVRERSRGGRTLRARKNIINCPCCPTDIAEFLQNPQVNTGVMEVIAKLQNMEKAEGASVDEKEEKAETEPEEETPIVTEEAEPPRKRAKKLTLTQ